MKLYYVYILKCADGFLYTGVTNNISRRLDEHQQGLDKSCYTYKRRPIELFFHQEFNDINQAIYFEKKIEKWSQKKKIALAEENFELLKLLTECKNKSNAKNRGLDSARPDINNIFEEHNQIRNQQVLLPVLQEKNIELFVKREDEIHSFVSGNKFRKLKYNILEAKKREVKTILTFGGAYSNHIAATAVAGKLYGLKTIGVIRGEELGVDLEKTIHSNATLRKAFENGMHFDFISRDAYRKKEESTFVKKMKEKHGDVYMIPEGGTNNLAIKGCEEILTNEDASFDYICCCVGTGGTISGLIRSAKEHQKVIGFPALKGDFLAEEIEQYVSDSNVWELQTDYHFGGYAKYQPSLIHFINEFKDTKGIPLDPIYTGKMVFGVVDMIKKGQFLEGSSILMIHTGGLQGIEGFNTMLARKNKELQINS